MKKVAIIFLFVAINNILFAQPGGGGPGGGGDPDVPIGGIEILLMAGAFFGIKKLINSSRSKN